MLCVKLSREEVGNYIATHEPEILILAETKWSIHSNKSDYDISGYEFQHVERNQDLAKKSGGRLLIYYKTHLRIHFWTSESDGNQIRISNERLWAICEREGSKYAIGGAYFAARSMGRGKEYLSWNEELLSLLEHDIDLLRKDGLKII